MVVAETSCGYRPCSGINDHIPRADVKVRYDNMHDFSYCLCDVCQAHKGRCLVLFKDDVASAFLNLPAHPIWQLCQVVSVDGKLYIVCRFVFWNCASPCIWCAVSGLLCWIAVCKLDIVGLHVVNSIYCFTTVNHRLAGPGKLVKLHLLFVDREVCVYVWSIYLQTWTNGCILALLTKRLDGLIS